MTCQQSIIVAVAGVSFVTICSLVVGQDQHKVGYKDTPMLPGGKWHVHDSDRPAPPVVTPGTSSTQDEPGRPPSDAVVLFDGKDLSHWHGRSGKPAAWKIENGAWCRAGGRRDHVDGRVRRLPAPPGIRGAGARARRGPGRGNSGVMFFSRYEIQVLDSFENLHVRRRPERPPSTGSTLRSSTPRARPASGRLTTSSSRRPIPRRIGSLESPAYVTMLHNGVLVHNHRRLIGAMAYRAVGKYTPHGPKGPILLQDHGNPVRFRNIWVRELKTRGAAVIARAASAPKS